MAKGGIPSSIGGAAMKAASSMVGTSSGARLQMFKQLQSALATGGRGMKGGFVHQAEARSTAAGQAALQNAGAATTTMAPSIRGRVLNRIMQANKANTAAIAPTWASALIGQVPAAIGGAAEGQAAAYRVAAEGETAANEAARTRAQGISSAAASVAGTAGPAASTWFNKYFRPLTTVPTPQTPAV